MRLAAVVLAFIGMVGMRPCPASASFHEMRIVEVFAGTAEQPEAQYVMLQMYSRDQNFVGGHRVDVFNGDGTSVDNFTFPMKVENGTTQATILIATAQAAAFFGVTPDLEMDPVIVAAGGAVCWANLDCVSWGAFSGQDATPSPSGTPFNAEGGLTLGMAMRRDVGKDGNPATLSAADDTNDSAGDFFFAAPLPKNNQGETGLPTPTATGAVATPTSTPTSTPTTEATPSATPGTCGGYCNGTGQASQDELLMLVSIALDESLLSSCQAGDIHVDEMITVEEIISAVEGAMNACPVVSSLPRDLIGTGSRVRVS